MTEDEKKELRRTDRRAVQGATSHMRTVRNNGAVREPL